MNFNRKTTDLKKGIISSKTDPFKFISPNATVWVRVRDPDPSGLVFKKALVISLDASRNTVKVRVLESNMAVAPGLNDRIYEEYQLKDVLKVNSLYRPQGYDDLTRMLVVNEAEIVANFKTRFLQGLHYNYINNFLVFLNGNQVPVGLFSRTNISFYKKMMQNDEALGSKDFLPHVYGEVGDSLKCLKSRDQALIFTGDTGSGKTLNFTKACEFLSLLNKESKESKGLGEFLDLSGECLPPKIPLNFP